jgi:hypothetical protein
MLIRVIIARMRHDCCGGREGKGREGKVGCSPALRLAVDRFDDRADRGLTVPATQWPGRRNAPAKRSLRTGTRK